MMKNTKPEHQADGFQTTSRRRGRPKCFDEQEALQKAMHMFWQYGYEATSINDLTCALRITAPSVYSTFGDKAQLFEKCLDYYLKYEACPMDEIFSQAKTAKIAIELYLYVSLKRLIQADKPTGCMLIVATMNCSNANSNIQHAVWHKRKSSKDKMYSRLTLGQHLGEFPASVDIQALTDFYVTLIQGMSIQARDGASALQLEAVVKMAMRCWDNLMM